MMGVSVCLLNFDLKDFKVELKPSVLYAILCACLFTAKTEVLKYSASKGHGVSDIIFNYQGLNALFYAILCLTFTPTNPKKDEFGMGILAGSFDMISSSLLGIAFGNGPSDLV